MTNPQSFIRKKGLISSFSTEHSLQRIVDGIDPEEKEYIFSIKRCLNPDRTPSTRVEFSFDSVIIPRSIEIEGFLIPITPVIPSRSKCKNCKGPHVASSANCPTYHIEFEVTKMRYLANIKRLEAIEKLRETSSELFINSSSNPGSPSSKLLEVNNNDENNKENEAEHNNEEFQNNDLELDPGFPNQAHSVSKAALMNSIHSNFSTSLDESMQLIGLGLTQEGNLDSDSEMNVDEVPLLSDFNENNVRNFSTPYWQQTIITQS